MVLQRCALQGLMAFGIVLGTVPVCMSQTVAPTVEDTRPGIGPSGDRVIEDRTVTRQRVGDRTVVEERVVERHREGEVYVAGFGGFTWGHQFSGVEGTGTLNNQGQIGSQDLANSVVYGAKIGYFHPGRLNWLGLEVEGFNSTPHIEQGAGLPGSHLRVTTLAFNLIARTKVGCRHGDDDDVRYRRTPVADRHDDEDRPYAHDRSSFRDNERCPVQLYAGVGPGIFFAETSNALGRSTDNGRVGLNALAGAKFFLTRHVAAFAEYKFNYAQFDFVRGQGSTAGISGEYTASHVVGGLALHF